MKKVLILSAILAGAAFANPYAKCVACHGANGEKVALGKSKIMKDMTKQEIIDSLKGYKDGTYGGPMKAVMTPQVAGLSDADIQAIAEKIGK
ncbi:c-type cytochrome [Arcobacter arenosus]|jgi:cytochrome c553|uniref:C-type cytochrome n=1 Tax=Arcobacter arenosus TaxID=2576037 RepID=A0A5R8XY00_9BACT|nr:c-type cytochrome [Arcobacter arenosus]TLP35770.1 c-type cytochrome [Arcobacter arenosus]